MTQNLAADMIKSIIHIITIGMNSKQMILCKETVIKNIAEKHIKMKLTISMTETIKKFIKEGS